MITRHGIEGGPVYTHSAALRDAIDRDGHCTMLIDLHPDLAIDRLIERLERRRPKDSVATVPSSHDRADARRRSHSFARSPEIGFRRSRPRSPAW